MKKTQRRDLVTTIRGTAVSFFSILMFVALGVGVFLGIHWTSGSLLTMADDALQRGRGHDLEINYPYGLTNDDLKALAKIEGIDEVEAGYVTYRELEVEDESIVIKVHSLPASIDTFLSCEGKLPTGKDQVALEATWAAERSIKLGDTVKLAAPDEDGDTHYLTNDSFTVSALVTSPAYLATSRQTYGATNVGSGSVDGIAWLPEDVFDADAFHNGKPCVLIRSASLDGLSSFDDAYLTQTQALDDRIHKLGDKRSTARYKKLKADAQDALAKSEKKLKDAQNDLRGQRQRLDDTTRDLEQRSKDLDERSKQVDQMEASLGAAAEWSPELAQAKSELSAAKEQLAQAQKQLKEGEKTYADAEAKLKEQQRKFDKRKTDVDNMRDLGWSVLQRRYNASVVSIQSYADVMKNLRWSMASLFLVVGLFVCYSAMSRIVYEQTSRIGTKKALGFRQREISALFLSYSTITVALGVAIAVPCSLLFVEGVILMTMNDFFVCKAALYLQAQDIAILAALELVLINLSTWVAVRGILKRRAVDLLAGQEAPSAKGHFYERWGLWKRLDIFAQTAINNCANDKRRLVATIVGVAGCTALVVTAITLQNDVGKSLVRQYEAIYHYDKIVYVDHNKKSVKAVTQALKEAGMRSTPVLRSTHTLKRPDGTISSAIVLVPSDVDAFKRFYTLIDLETPAESSEDDDGVSVSAAYEEHMGARIGDNITLRDAAGDAHELPIQRFFEFHMLNYEIAMSPTLYKRTFDSDATPNCLLVDTGGKQRDEVISTLKDVRGFQTCVNDKANNEESFGEFMQIATIVVLVYMALAVVMAAVVLLNLNMMFIAEKKRELIILMICGFSVRQAKGYIWHDSVVLTALGTLCGLALGTAAGSYAVNSIETSVASLLTGPSELALVIGTLASIVLAGAALLWSLRLIPRLKLSDINEP